MTSARELEAEFNARRAVHARNNAMSKTEVAKNNAASNLPAHLQGGKTASLGNLDQSDLIIPRVKLLHATSPEVTEQDGAKVGEFWHTIAGMSLGKELLGIPIVFRKSVVLWAPRGDERGILARSEDAVHWDNWQNEDGTPKSFTVKHKDQPIQTYTLAPTVKESGLLEFGSKIKGDDQSHPAAALTYQMMWYFPEFSMYSPALMINTRSAIAPAKTLISKLQSSPVDHFAMRVVIGVAKQIANGETFLNYTYRMDGFADEGDFNTAKSLYEQYGDAKWRANEEAEETSGESGSAPKAKGAQTSNKF